MKVYLIGVGMGSPETMTVGALEAIKACPVLVGAVACWSPGQKATTACLSLPGPISRNISARCRRGRWVSSCRETPAFTAGPKDCGPCCWTMR